MQNNKYFLIDRTEGICTQCFVTFPHVIVDYLVKQAHHDVQVLSPTENILYYNYSVVDDGTISCDFVEIGRM